MIDIHCHILWGVDDGPQSPEEKEDLINLANAEGITDIIATAHYSPYLEQVYEEKFEEAASMARSVGINLYSGCEYKLQDALLLKDRLITLAGSDFILVEITSGVLGDFVYNQVYDLELAGYQVILAHPERSFMPADLPKLRKLGDMGVYFQITAGSIAGKFGKQIQRFAFKLLEEGLCHFIASDAHNPHSRAFFSSEAKSILQKKELAPQAINLLFHENASKVLSGEPSIRSFSLKRSQPSSRKLFPKRGRRLS